MESYSNAKSLISRIGEYVSSGIKSVGTAAAILAASQFSYAQDAPKTESKPAVETAKQESLDEKVEEFKLPFSPSPLFLPQRLNSTYVGGGFRSGKGDNDVKGSIVEGNFRFDDFSQNEGGVYIITEGSKINATGIASEDVERYSFDPALGGTIDTKRTGKDGYTLFGANAFGGMLQLNSVKTDLTKRYRIFEVITDDPGVPLRQTSQRDLDAELETSITALRL